MAYVDNQPLGPIKTSVSETVDGVIIKEVRFTNSATMIEYAGQSVLYSITKSVNVSGGN